MASQSALETALEAQGQLCRYGLKTMNCDNNQHWVLIFDSAFSCKNAVTAIGSDNVQVGFYEDRVIGTGEDCARIAFNDIPANQRTFVEMSDGSQRLQVSLPVFELPSDTGDEEENQEDIDEVTDEQRLEQLALLDASETENSQRISQYVARFTEASANCGGEDSTYTSVRCALEEDWSLLFDSATSCQNAEVWLDEQQIQILSDEGEEPCGKMEYSEIDIDYRTFVLSESGESVVLKVQPKFITEPDQIEEAVDNAGGLMIIAAAAGGLVFFWLFCCICVSTRCFRRRCALKRCRKCCLECKCNCWRA